METYSQKTLNKINRLLEIIRNAEVNYKNVADKVDSTDLKEFLERKSSKRLKFINEIKNHIKLEDGQYLTEGQSPTGATIGLWTDVKGWFSSRSTNRVLEEIQKVDNMALKTYEEVLNDADLQMATRNLLEKQKHTIETDLNKIKSPENLK